MKSRRNLDGSARGYHLGPSRGITMTVGFAIRSSIEPALGDFLREGGNLVGEDLNSLLPDLHPSLDIDRIIRIQEFHGFSVHIAPGNDFDEPALVFQVGASVADTLLCASQLESLHDSADIVVSGPSVFLQLGDGRNGDPLDDSVVVLQGMTGNINTPRLLIERYRMLRRSSFLLWIDMTRYPACSASPRASPEATG